MKLPTRLPVEGGTCYRGGAHQRKSIPYHCEATSPEAWQGACQDYQWSKAAMGCGNQSEELTSCNRICREQIINL